MAESKAYMASLSQMQHGPPIGYDVPTSVSLQESLITLEKALHAAHDLLDVITPRDNLVNASSEYPDGAIATTSRCHNLLNELALRIKSLGGQVGRI